MQVLEISMDELMPLLQAQLASGVNPRLTVTGTSMQPMLRNRKDSVLLCPAADPKKGDILLYRRKNGSYVLHRVIGFSGNALLCCGDNQWCKEEVSREQVEATVCGYYRDETKKSLTTFGYKFYVNLLPLRRLYCHLRDWLFH